MSTLRDFGYEFAERILEWVGLYLSPEEVFSLEQLSDWAEQNGYIKEDES